MSESALKRLRRKTKEKEVEKKTKALRREQIEKEKMEHVQLIRVIYVDSFDSCTPTKKKKTFEQKHRSRELEEELEVTLNFFKITIIFTIKPAPQIILTLDSDSEVEIGPQQ
jgi:hypothetical protein